MVLVVENGRAQVTANNGSRVHGRFSGEQLVPPAMIVIGVGVDNQKLPLLGEVWPGILEHLCGRLRIDDRIDQYHKPLANDDKRIYQLPVAANDYALIPTFIFN